MKVDVAGLIAAAQKLLGLATSAQGAGPGEMPPLAADPTSGGCRGPPRHAPPCSCGESACAQAYSLHKAAAHLVMIAAKFGGRRRSTQPASRCCSLPAGVGHRRRRAGHAGPRSASIPPDVRLPLPPLTHAQRRSLLPAGHHRLAGRGAGFSTTATNNGTADRHRGATVREVAATVPDLWDSPDGTAALAGRLNEHVTALTTIADRWFELARPGAQARRRLQPDGHRDAQAAGVQGERGTRCNQAQAAEEHASPYRSCCSSAV